MKTTIKIGIAALLMVGYSACDSNTAFDEATQYARVYMPQATDYPLSCSLKMQDTAQTLVYGAEFGSPGKQPGNITVDFQVNPALVDSFNQANGTTYLMLPKGSYALSDEQAVIAAADRQTPPLQLRIKTIGFLTPQISYLLPVSVHAPEGVKVNRDLQTTYYLIRGDYVEYDRRGWQIDDVDSEQKDPLLPATNVLDGNPATFWHTEYAPVRPPLPHHVTIDMGSVHTLHGLRIIGREGFTRGDPKDIVIAVSTDGKQWENGETFTTRLDQINEETFYLTAPAEGRYFKLTVTSSYGDDHPPIAHIAEIFAF